MEYQIHYIRMLLSITVFIFSLIVHTSEAAVTIDSLVVNSSLNDTNNNGKPDVRQQTDFEITILLTVTLDPESSNVEVWLTRPGQGYTNNVGCVVLATGDTVADTCTSLTSVISDISWDIDDSYITTSSGLSPVITKSYITVSEPLQISYLLFYENVVSTISKTINITQEVHVDAGWDSANQNFTVNAAITNVTNSASIVNSTIETYQVEIVGPFLKATLYSNITTASVGDTIVHYATIQHSSDSTEVAYNMRVTIDVSESTAVPISLVNLIINSGSNNNLTSSYNSFDMETYSMNSTFAMSDVATLTFTRTVGTNMAIGAAISVTVYLTWDDYNGTQYSHSDITVVTADDLNFTDPNATDLPTSFYQGDTVTFGRTFTMPPGKLNNPELYIEFVSGDISSIPMSVQSALLSYDSSAYPSMLTFDNPSYLSQISGSTEQWTITTSANRRKRSNTVHLDLDHVRVKRASGSTWTLTVPFGSITNGLTVNVPFTVALSLLVSSQTAGGTATSQVSLTYNGLSALINYNPSVLFLVPILQITKTVAVVDTSSLPHKVRFNMTVDHNSLSNSDAYSVALVDGNTDFEVFFYQSFLPGFPHSSISIASDTIITYSNSHLNTTDSMFLSYEAGPVDSGVDFPSGDTYYTATVTWYPTSSASSGNQYSATGSVCITKNDIIVESVFYQHGFTVLGLLFGVIAGALIGVLIVLLIWLFRRKCPCAGVVAPTFFGDVASSGKGLITSTSVAMQKGFIALKNSGSAAINDSIVQLLAFKDKLRQNRQLDNLDIISTIQVDGDIEKERNEAMIKATTLLPASLRLNGDLSKNTEENCRKKFMKNLAASDKVQEDEYKKEMQDLFRRLSMKNKTKLEELKDKHKFEKSELEEKIRKSGMTNEEQEELKKLQQQEHDIENEDLNYRLKLEQDEESEKIRKEYSIRKRMAIKAFQQEYLDDVVREGKLPSQEQIDWLMKEHFKNQGMLETMYDEEISRQRMVLEEKLARRRALAQKAELQEEAHSDVLNTVASQHIEAIKKAKKAGVLTPAEAKQMIADAQNEMVVTKKKQDTERERQEKTLHDKLSQRKKEKMAELKKRQNQELSELDKKINVSMNSTGVDPLGALQERQQLISNQRTENAEVENEMDREHAKELEQLRNQMSDSTKKELVEGKEQDLDELRSNGLSDRDIQKMLHKHDKDLELLDQQQAEDRASQEANFKKKLNAQRKEWLQRKELEKQEQSALREHEENIVRKLMDNQVAMSEEERNKILQEHEKQMVMLDNSLTLNKISQKRMLEEKLAKKRAAQLEKLEKKQAVEVKKSKKESEYSEDEDDNAELELRKKHAEQRMEVMQGDMISIDSEVESIREEMARERATALEEQEVKLAAMVADLQMAKAKEMTQIEEQQKAIHNLTANLMDDLNEKGVLSGPECQRVIKIHQEEKEKLTNKLDSQKAKQEQMLRRKLNERLKHKEDQMSRIQQSEINDSLSGLGNTTAAKLKRAALLTKHMVEVEKFRNRMEKEINQTLEELHRQNDIRRMNAIQEQDLQFLNGLVRLGKFTKDELENVVAMLFPTKSNEELKALLEKLMEGYVEPKPKDVKNQIPEPKGLSRRTSSLEQRVRSASIAKVDTASLEGSFRGKKKKGRKGRQVQHLDPNYDEDFDHQSHNSSYSNSQFNPQHRPDPIGRSYTPDNYGDRYDEDFDTGGRGRGLDALGLENSIGSKAGLYGRTPTTKLPPLESFQTTPKKKKKKKPLVTLEDDYDDDGF